ncbi:MAG: ribonuclease P protein component [Alphaproteobacteria bacterium]
MNVEHITKRADFLRAARGRKAARPSLVLQMWDRGDNEPCRVGFTASKKVGNAVQRNRAKRRLRAAVGKVFADHAQPGRDYVLIARKNTPNEEFSQIIQDLMSSIAAVERRKK